MNLIYHKVGCQSRAIAAACLARYGLPRYVAVSDRTSRQTVMLPCSLMWHAYLASSPMGSTLCSDCGRSRAFPSQSTLQSRHAIMPYINFQVRGQIFSSGGTFHYPSFSSNDLLLTPIFARFPSLTTSWPTEQMSRSPALKLLTASPSCPTT